MAAGYASPASLNCGAQANPGGLKARCLAGLLLLGAVLLPAAPAAGQVTAPPAVTFTGHSSGFVTGAGQALTAGVTPANPPAGHTAVYQWYRGVDATSSGGAAISGASSSTYMTVNDDRGYRLGLGVRHRRNSDDVMSPETRATTFVGVRPERVPQNLFSVEVRIIDDRGVFIPIPNPTALQVGEVVNYGFNSGAPPTGFGYSPVKPIQRRLGSLGDDWIDVPNRFAVLSHRFAQSDIGYSFRVCEQWVPIAPRVIGSELTCHLALGGALVQPLPLRFNGAISNQTYVTGTPIPALALPAASGGSGSNSYTLPNLPSGLSFNPGTRVLSGTPGLTMAASAYTYTVTDVVSSNTNLIFTIQVLPPDAVRMRLRVFLEGPLQ